MAYIKGIVFLGLYIAQKGAVINHTNGSREIIFVTYIQEIPYKEVVFFVNPGHVTTDWILYKWTITTPIMFPNRPINTAALLFCIVGI